MIISKKKFNEEIAKVINETQERMYREQSLRDDFRYIRDDITRIERRVGELERCVNCKPVPTDSNEIRPTYIG